MNLLTLNLEGEVPKPATVNFWPFFDLCLIGLFTTLFGSSFVIAPGINIGLPRSNHVQMVAAERLQVMSVNELSGEEQIIFEDRILNLRTLKKMLEQRGGIPERVTLLVRSDAAVSIQTLASIFEIAEEAGYENIQLATENRAVEARPLGEMGGE